MADLSVDFRAFWDNDPELRHFEPQEADERLWKAGRASMHTEAMKAFMGGAGGDDTTWTRMAALKP